jgi:hypothetical protein
MNIRAGSIKPPELNKAWLKAKTLLAGNGCGRVFF